MEGLFSADSERGCPEVFVSGLTEIWFDGSITFEIVPVVWDVFQKRLALKILQYHRIVAVHSSAGQKMLQSLANLFSIQLLSDAR